jgi:immune inhibitor A
MADWAVATFLDDPLAGDQYHYSRLDVPRPALQARVQQLPYSEFQELDQFAVHYVGIDQPGPLTLTFAGDTTARLIDAPPTSGEQMWYALPSNDSNAQLTGTFDLSRLDKATLSFNAWYDLEQGYDFAYVSVSADQGSTWDVLQPQHGEPGDYGPALSGNSTVATDGSQGWIRETLSLNQYAGKQILLRFQVLTDFETTGRGLALDDIAITELGFYDDVESGTGNWEAQGFARTGWLLPQQWAVRLIPNGQTPRVIPLELNPLNQISHPLDLGAEGGTLVIMPLTPFVDETAQYWLQVD